MGDMYIVDEESWGNTYIIGEEPGGQFHCR